MSLSEFRVSFARYAEENNIALPDKFMNANEIEFVAAINAYIKPLSHDMDLCYSNLETLITISGCEAPKLSEEQTNKVKRYLQAFIKACE